MKGAVGRNGRTGRGLAYADIVGTSSIGLGQASGCLTTAGAALRLQL